ncbi:hypothetical protein B0H63DRAFT_505689 [Podospora didyma]|uniref:Transmembrane protein n=1 Tax=Podospora didyma TaxID=330526 RepID=A0AAE0P5M1_9PEZI|nr:hypothetical protein B0H63DRAFT_505689 [Podospora didyma]
MSRYSITSVLAVVLVGATLVSAISNITEAIPQLEDLAPLPSTGHPIKAGGQDWAHCCLLAVNASFQVNHDNATLEYSSRPFLNPTLVSASDFAIAATTAGGGSFPCGATFDGKNFEGAPEVRAPYSWCISTCDGWQVSHRGALTQWIGPLVGFILPCLAFCLNIPRRSKLRIPDWVFSPSPKNALPVLLFPVRLSAALFMVTADTVGWLCICFALAGPMLLSGVYETWIDMRLLWYLFQRIVDAAKTDQVLSMKLRAQLLLLVVVGNIDIAEGKERLFLDILRVADGLERTNDNRLQHVVHVKSRLSALSSSQPSFGSAVGAPVVFFVGAFIYNIIDVQTRLGDNDTAHALAFGMWWMTIPFLAIISSLLLASNNPGSLHGFLGVATRPTRTFTLFERAYGGPYEPVDLWNRGPNKMYWLQKIVEECESEPNTPNLSYASYPANYLAPDSGVPRPTSIEIKKEQLGKLKGKMQPGMMDWCVMLAAAIIPLAASFSLAFVTSYNTPRVGLACRSLTHLLYFVTQIAQMMLWMYWNRVVVDDERKPDKIGAFLGNSACLALKLLLGFLAAFIGIGGTLMQLIGVYRNCLCKIPVQYWLHKNDPGAYVLLGSNSAESIRNAQEVWTRTAGAATGILGAACALAWWLQRHLRSRYKALVENMEAHPSW